LECGGLPGLSVERPTPSGRLPRNSYWFAGTLRLESASFLLQITGCSKVDECAERFFLTLLPCFF